MNEQLESAWRARGARDGRSELRAFLAPIAKRLGTRATVALTGDTRAEPSPRPRASGGGALVVVGLVAVTAVTVGLGLSAWPSAPRATRAAPIAVADATADPDAGSVAADAAIAIVVATADAGRAHAPRRATTHDAPSSTSTSASPSPTGSGWIRIVAGCDAARAGSVSVDGRPSDDHVPTTVRLSIGTHRVRVVAADGTPFEGVVEVTAFHTEGSPAWFRACSP